jgi:NhaP-type Na+/H+ or K+/H+ antiporter
MSPTNTPTSNTELVDKDMAEQARPGHGIPSQDPEAAAQSPLNPEEAEREANSVLAGGGVIVGAAAGAALGTLVAGPVGAVVAGAVGAVAGALGGVAAGPLVSEGDTDATDPSKKVPVKP